MQNVELKAVCRNLDLARQHIRELGGKFLEKLRQRDVYFDLPGGRLKLRLTTDKQAQLIYYRRPDSRDPETSDYYIYFSHNPDSLEKLLKMAFQVRGVVEKTREVYLIDNVRVHLDAVQGLGTFLEFEAVISPGYEVSRERQKLLDYQRRFGIKPEDVVAASYIDLLQKPEGEF